MALESTKLILERLRIKYTSALTHARQDIKPNYNSNIKFPLHGYSYDPLDDADRDFIYNSLGELQHIFNNRSGAIFFDLAHYITEKKAVADLQQTVELLENRRVQILEIKTKYAHIRPVIYPVDLVYNYYTEILDVLQNEILDSDEFKQFESPGLINTLKQQNADLAFQLYWKKRKWAYLSHFIAFLPFLAAGIIAILFKDDSSLSKCLGISITLFLGLFTTLFNLFFGFYSTFKDTYKMFLPSTRKQLMEQEKEKFLKTYPPQ